MENTDLIKRITMDPLVMGGKPCIRGMRITVGLILELLSQGNSHEKILEYYPYLEPGDIFAALLFGAYRSEEIDLPFLLQEG